ncbi:hypothetical protein BKN38_02910 [Helicobacter sp. CLO-3]|uniref:helix-turn-helix domain-containing protein n=1 Tax=unclassified Helicobacter TaxID=2593540 RepID=UPI000806073C|nr:MULTISPECIES: hypothetical protein [unclassified Helicobacter]OBV29562.1 hypothetical protein BA723_05080 [Helicobacter sp. CLO-3]OHU84549.1 hypothetical protein BKN38_02910 [Helicobacter sp. CLO-3]
MKENSKKTTEKGLANSADKGAQKDLQKDMIFDPSKGLEKVGASAEKSNQAESSQANSAKADATKTDSANLDSAKLDSGKNAESARASESSAKQISQDSAKSEEAKNLTQENLEKLRKIGVKEIAHQTRISTARIQDILDGNFEHTQRVHLVGFLQILEREYKLDLSGVLKAFEAQQKSKNKKPEVKAEKSVQVQDLSLDTQKRRYDAIDERKKQASSKQKFYLTFISVIIVVFAYLIYQNIASKYISSQEEDRTIQDIDADAKAGDAQEGAESKGDASDESAEDGAIDVSVPSQNADSSASAAGANANANSSGANSSNSSASTSASAPSQNAESSASTQTQSAESSTIQSALYPTSRNMMITTNIMLWFDIIDLDTNRRKYQGVTSDSYSIKTDNHRWLLAFGHSNFNLTMNGEPFTFEKSNYPLYFIYEPENGFKKIDNQTYKRLSEQVR